MNTPYKINKSLITFSTILLVVIPLFGFKFLISLLSNILLLLFLVPILIFLVVLVSFYSFKSKLKKCYQCGAISSETNNQCTNCGADLSEQFTKDFEKFKKPGETTIEINAEEIL